MFRSPAKLRQAEDILVDASSAILAFGHFLFIILFILASYYLEFGIAPMMTFDIILIQPSSEAFERFQNTHHV